jgi:transposase
MLFVQLILGRLKESYLPVHFSGRFRNFAEGLRQDEAAVRAAMTYQWSNGMVEGHVNRLKLIKRQMYGCAKFDLLRARVLLAA